MREFFDDCREIGLQMERIVVHLLSLSRLEAGMEVTEIGAFRLAPFVQLCWDRLARQTRNNDTALDLEVPEHCMVETDCNKLAIIVNNLLSNAVAYGERGQDVRCFVTEDDKYATLTIANRSHELEESDLPFLFDRFWRKDEARALQQHGGLGLSIVRAVAKLLEIKIAVQLEPTGIFRISLRIPKPVTAKAGTIPAPAALSGLNSKG